MSRYGYIDDLANRDALRVLIDWAQVGEPIPIRRLRALVNGAASNVDVLTLGERWLASLLDLAQRAGVGQLERNAAGALVFMPQGCCSPVRST